MKKIVFFILLICSIFNSFAQSKYKYNVQQGNNFIKKASRNVKLHNYKKALRMISNAKNSDYGFCGNAWAESYDEIHHLEIEIFNNKKEYEKSLAILDSINACSFGADCFKRDAVKIKTLIKKFGKQKVKESFDHVIEIKRISENDYETKTYVYLTELNYYFYFQNEVDIIFDDNDKITSQYILKQQSFYKLLE